MTTMAPEPKSWSSDLIWKELTGHARDDLIERVNPVDAKYQISESTRMVETQLSFYDDNVKLLLLTDINWGEKIQIYYLVEGDNLYRLNGTSPPIHEINSKAPIKLDEANVLDYLRFFCFFVRGEEGAFLVLESLDQPDIISVNNESVQDALATHAYPARFNKINEKGHFVAGAVIWYSNAIFAAHFEIHKTGMIEMNDDEPIAADLTESISNGICELA